MVYKGGVDWKAPGAFQTHYARAEFVAYDLPGVNNCDRKASGGQTQCSIVARGPGAYDDNIVQILDPSFRFAVPDTDARGHALIILSALDAF